MWSLGVFSLSSVSSVFGFLNALHRPRKFMGVLRQAVGLEDRHRKGVSELRGSSPNDPWRGCWLWDLLAPWREGCSAGWNVIRCLRCIYMGSQVINPRHQNGPTSRKGLAACWTPTVWPLITHLPLTTVVLSYICTCKCCYVLSQMRALGLRKIMKIA